MRFSEYFPLGAACLLLTGCTTAKRPGMVAPLPASYATESQPIETSLFPSDQAILGEEAVNRILSSRLELPPKARLAIMKFPEGAGRYGRYYWRDEDYIRLKEQQVNSIISGLRASERVSEVMPLPTLMTPKQASIPVLREAAVRLQADLLLVYRVVSDTYSQYRLLTKDKVKAYSTCEVVLLDVRTGLVPFTRVITRERMEPKQTSDFDLNETMRRAEQESAMEALAQASKDLVEFIGDAPKRGG